MILQTTQEREEQPETQVLAGYLHPQYALSLSEFGRPLELPLCKGWVLERQIPGFADCDATGCYPLFACQDWSQLDRDLDHLGDELVSLSLVTDPFGDYDESYLKHCFNDVVLAFKEHYIVDLLDPLEKRISRHTRKDVHKALRNIDVEVCENPLEFMEEWVVLYGHMIERFNIRSIRAFSRASFVMQFDIPGLIMYRALHAGEAVGIALVMAHADKAYGHLIGFNAIGYELGASDAIYWYCIHDLGNRGIRWFDLGGGPGVSKCDRDSLKEYKNKWAAGTRMAYFCGRIYHPRRYTEIVQSRGIGATNYFPAYRVGEMG